MAKEIEKVNKSNLMKAFNWSYELLEKNVPEFVESYQNENPDDVDAQIDSLIKWQCTKSFASGFATGLGGFWTLPVAIPADIAFTMKFQAQMVASIAYLRGYNLKDDQVKAAVLCTMIGSTLTDMLHQTGTIVATGVARGLINQIPKEALKKINEYLGVKLFTKFGTKAGSIALGKAIPVISGIVGGSINLASTKSMAKLAKKNFKNIRD